MTHETCNSNYYICNLKRNPQLRQLHGTWFKRMPIYEVFGKLIRSWASPTEATLLLHLIGGTRDIGGTGVS